MHREQAKCKLPNLPAEARTEVCPDFSTFNANLHCAKLGLLIHIVWTALADASRSLKRLFVH